MVAAGATVNSVCWPSAFSWRWPKGSILYSLIGSALTMAWPLSSLRLTSYILVDLTRMVCHACTSNRQAPPTPTRTG